MRPARNRAGFSIPVAPVAVIALLKMISYLDRPHERNRDLSDLAYILEDYIPPDDDRRFDPQVLDAGVKYEQASAYVLGLDLGELANDAERQAGAGKNGLAGAAVVESRPRRAPGSDRGL